MFDSVLLVHVRFFFRTFLVTFPVSAEFGLKQTKRSKVGPLGAGELLDHQFHVLVVHLGVELGILGARRWTGVYVASLDLPEDVGGAVETFSGEIGFGKVVVNAV